MDAVNAANQPQLKSGRTGVCPNQKYITSQEGSILEWATKSV